MNGNNQLLNHHIHRKNISKNYIKFINGDGNYSSVGMRGGEQILSISKYDSNKGTALHEIGHALGLIHEQQRRDRDEYININWDNIQSDKKVISRYGKKVTP